MVFIDRAKRKIGMVLVPGLAWLCCWLFVPAALLITLGEPVRIARSQVAI